MTRLLPLFPLAAVLTCCLVGCGVGSSPTPRLAWTEVDPWYTGLPSGGSLYWTWPELDQQRIHEVIQAREAKAEGLLQDVPLLEISVEQAGELLGQDLPNVPGTKPYLTRGLYLNRQTHMFSIYVSGDQLVVHHGTLGTSPQTMKRQALILQLESRPAEVFLYCSMAE